MAECQQAFEDLKAYLSSPPLLSPSKPGEELFLYLAVSLTAHQRSLDQRIRQGAKTHVLRQPGTSWCRREVPIDGEARIRFGYSIPQAQAVLLSPYSDRPY